MLLKEFINIPAEFSTELAQFQIKARTACLCGATFRCSQGFQILFNQFPHIVLDTLFTKKMQYRFLINTC